MNYDQKEPRAAWAITWILAAWVIGWPFFLLHGSARLAVGIPWVIALFVVIALIGERHARTARNRPDDH